MSTTGIDQLNSEQRQEAEAWLEGEIESSPEFFRPVLASMLAGLAGGPVSKSRFNTLSRELARALGIIPSSERRKSGDPLGSLKNRGKASRPKNDRERLERQRERCSVLIERYGGYQDRHQSTIDRLNERLKQMANNPDENGIGIRINDCSQEAKFVQISKRAARGLAKISEDVDAFSKL